MAGAGGGAATPKAPATAPRGALLRRRPGAPAVSRARRGWRRAWRGWARGRAAAARGRWLALGRATSTAGAAATAPTTPPPPPPGARTGRPGPKASSCLSGMRVLPDGGREPGRGGERVLSKHRGRLFATRALRSQLFKDRASPKSRNYFH